MKRLIVYALLLVGLVLRAPGICQAQRHRGQALVARPSRAHYYRGAVYRDYYKPPRRPHFHYAPSYHAYYNRSPYRPRVHYYRRPAKQAPVALAR